MSTGLEWTRLSKNRSTARYKIVAVGDRDSLSLSLSLSLSFSFSFSCFLFFIFLFFFNIICMYIYINVFSFYQHISRTRFETTIWGLVKYCRMRDGYFDGRSENDKKNISRRVRKIDYSIIGMISRYWVGDRSTIRNVHDVIWINPSITCLVPETFAQTSAY